MVDIDLTEYLKQVSELEASVNRQENILEETKRKLSQNRPRQPFIKEPVLEQKSLPKQEYVVDKGENSDRLVRKWILIFGSFFLVLGFLSIMIPDEEAGETITLDFGSMVCFIAGIVCLISGIYYTKKIKTNKEHYRRQNDELQYKYDQEVKKIKEYNERQKNIFKNQLEQHKRDQENANIAYIKEMERYSVAELASEQLVHSLNETRDTLAKLYELDIVFPKYRNLIAMTTMYEYLASGRCSELKGPNGAYNLYESEVRQNIIISELSVVMTQLEDIKQNQYVLYNELHKTNEVLYDISSDIQMLMNQTAEISSASKITAFCSQITAQNTAALAYIAMING